MIACGGRLTKILRNFVYLYRKNDTYFNVNAWIALKD